MIHNKGKVTMNVDAQTPAVVVYSPTKNGTLIPDLTSLPPATTRTVSFYDNEEDQDSSLKESFSRFQSNFEQANARVPVSTNNQEDLDAMPMDCESQDTAKDEDELSILSSFDDWELDADTGDLLGLMETGPLPEVGIFNVREEGAATDHSTTTVSTTSTEKYTPQWIDWDSLDLGVSFGLFKLTTIFYKGRNRPAVEL